MDQPRYWAQRTAEEIRKRHDEERLNKQTFLAETELKKTQAPLLWGKVKDALESHAALLASACHEPDLLVITSQTGDDVSVRAKTAGVVSAEFDRERLSVTARLVSTIRNYVVGVANGTAVFIVPEEGIKTPEDIAQECLNALARYL